MRRSAELVGAVVLAGAALLGACTSPADSVDSGAAEAAVAKVVRPRIPVAIEEVRCPSKIERRAGATVTCTVALADDAGSVRVSVTPRGDGDQLDVDLLDVALDRAQVGRQLHDALVAEYARSFTVDCGTKGIAVVAPGKSISCSATDEGGRRKVAATVVDARGTLRFDLGGGS